MGKAMGGPPKKGVGNRGRRRENVNLRRNGTGSKAGKIVPSE